MKNKYFILLISSAILSSCHEKVDDRSDAEASSILPVTTVAIKSSEQNQTLSLSGTIQAEKTAQVAFSIQGTVKDILVAEGQSIKKGQLLATLDPRDYQFQLEQAQASLLKAKDTYTRDKQLNEGGSITPQELVNAQSQYLSAEVSKKSAEKKLADTRLYAPIEGTVTRKTTEIGAQASPSNPAFTIDKISVVEVIMTVPETQIGNVMHNNTADINVPAINETFTGKITSINPQGDNGSNTYRTKIRIDNTKGKLLPGMIAEVSLKTNYKAKYITIPPKAIVHDEDDLLYVFLVDNASGKAVKRKITIGQALGDKAVILDGIKEDDQLIIEGQARLKDGQSVSIKQ